MEKYYIELFFQPLIIFASGILAGLLFEKIVMKRLKVFAQRTTWKSDDIVAHSIKGLPLSLCLIAGTYFAVHDMPIESANKEAVDKVLMIFFIVVVCIVSVRALTGFIGYKTFNETVKQPSTSIITNIVRLAVFLLGFVFILQVFGISVTPVLTALGVGGLAVALAMQDTLSNLFAGLQVIASRQIRINDYIRMDTGEEGYVTDINWRNTTVRALQNHLIVIPNSKISSAIIVNYNLPDKEVAVLVNIGISYGSDLEQVEQVTIATARDVQAKTPGAVRRFEPFIRYNTFADSSINFTAILRAEQFVDQYLLKHEFIKELQKKYREKNIEIPFPIRTVHLKQDK